MDELLEAVSFSRQVELNLTIDGIYPISKLARLSGALLSNEGFVTARLKFGNCAGFACLKGSVSASLVTECQRCLKPMQTEVMGRFKFALVNSEDEFELLPEELEPYLVEGEEQSIVELIEDELLLSLPMVIVHETACSAYINKHMNKHNSKMQAAIKTEKEAAHPFAALSALKGKKITHF
ncbi:DUF177 domain-containing protein [Cardiobacterium sp. AH-315-I02]|nr:DUF177 domain-containing protein [Cardiobacterium sp. AH-315-I02]